MRNQNIKLLYIDLFCGAGGTSTGVENATLFGDKCAKVIACVNHDKNAILSHMANHPDVLHFTEDIKTLELSPLIEHINKMKALYPDAYIVLWASLECTNFSKAKGGMPRNADSRTLAEHLFRYIVGINPDYIQIENVEEFMCWGDLDEKGKPVSRDQGRKYVKWVGNVMDYGYNYDYRILNSANFGAYTSRKRYFGQFAKCGLPIVFPVQTFAKNGDEGGMFSQYKKWKAVRDVLDLEDEGKSIFAKKKPLCEKTLERIYAGLIKFVAGGKKCHEDMILKYNSMNASGHYKPQSTDEPCPTVACQNRLGYVKLNFLSKQFSGNPMSKNQSIELPAGAVTTKDHHAIVSAKFLSEYYGGAEHNHPLSVPATTLTTRSRHAFVTAYFGNGYNTSIEEPNPTVTTKERHALVSIDLNEPMPDVPLDKVTIQSNRFIANPYSFKSDGGTLDKPCCTLIAHMDKAPLWLVTAEHGELGIAIFENDSPMTRKIKEFMATYGIIDIKMRMLNIRELKRIMGFPADYVLVGSQAEQKKYIGNAVEVNMSRVLCEALCMKLSDYKKKAI